MRSLLAAGLFAASVCAALVGPTAGQQPGQDKKADAKKAQQKFDPPKATKPDDATLKHIAEKTEQLRKAVAALKAKKLRDDVLIEVEIYLKAAENIVRFEEWYHANSGKWALTTLDQGLERAKQAAEWNDGEDNFMLWRKPAGKWIVRAYRSRLDSSIQPYALFLPRDYGKDLQKRWPFEIILHGRDSALTEAKFIATHQGPRAGSENLDRVILEVYGRGNNAYRWAGEEDVFEAFSRASFVFNGGKFGGSLADEKRIILRGFSMGGAGAWHIGLHHPDEFCVIGPGAGFTTTHGYVNGMPAKLPEYQEKCLHVYDAVDYAENAFNVPVVAYSGEIDPQKKAADNIQNALKGFKGPLRFTHLVAPGLEHQMPAEWQAKAEAEYRKYVDKGRDPNPERIRFVTYTSRYCRCDWMEIWGLEKQYDKTVVDARRDGNKFTVSTTNVHELVLTPAEEGPVEVSLDGQVFKLDRDDMAGPWFFKFRGAWVHRSGAIREWKALAELSKPRKLHRRSGPIDEAFTTDFWVIPPTDPGWHQTTDNYSQATLDQFAKLWDRYFRGALPSGPQVQGRMTPFGGAPTNLVLFGDPASNPKIAEVLPDLPIVWTKDKLVVNGVEYDPKIHVPVMIYPYLNASVVLNSGHTFREADLKGTNALLYPRLGDWAVVKPTPTDKDPAAYEVVAAGLFDENWQFKK
ncbi:MAG: hypothetical protein K2P78_09365 [Gemmataceae bacterium]|nr:hypothetical protein [Gemmataceae bacterium]